MSFSRLIIQSYLHPQRVVQQLLSAGPREDRAVGIIIVTCGLMFVAYLPELARNAHLTGSELAQSAAYAFFGMVIVMPLALYLISPLFALVMQIFGGNRVWHAARFACFWALLCAVPFYFLYGLTRGFIGSGIESQITGLLWLCVLLWVWIGGLIAGQFQR